MSFEGLSLSDLISSPRTSHRMAAMKHAEITAEQLVELVNAKPRSIQVRLAALFHPKFPKEKHVEVLFEDISDFSNEDINLNFTAVPVYQEFDDNAYNMAAMLVEQMDRIREGDYYNHALIENLFRYYLEAYKRGILAGYVAYSAINSLMKSSYHFHTKHGMIPPAIDAELFEETLLFSAIHGRDYLSQILKSNQISNKHVEMLLEIAESRVSVARLIGRMDCGEHYRIKAAHFDLKNFISTWRHDPRDCRLNPSVKLIELADDYAIKLEEAIDLFCVEDIHTWVKEEELTKAIEPDEISLALGFKVKSPEEDYYHRKTGKVITPQKAAFGTINAVPLTETVNLIMMDLNRSI